MTNLPRPEHPRPDWVRADWRNLNGEWDFALDPGRSGESRGLPDGQGFDRKIIVPFAPESKLSGIGHKDFMPCVWYHRTFAVEPGWTANRILLHFGAVDYDATVWINGRIVGVRPGPFTDNPHRWQQLGDYHRFAGQTHRGGYAPFTLDITEHVAVGEDNRLVVCAVDDTRSGLQPSGKQNFYYETNDQSRCFYTRTTGIWQTVWLETVPNVYIDHARVTPDVAGQRLQIEATLKGAVAGSGPRTAMLKAVARAEGRVVAEAQTSAAAPNTSLTLCLPEPRLWEPSDPFLYDLELVLETKSGVDRVQSYFGMRSIRLAEGCLFVNDKPVFQRLVLDQGFYPDGIYTAPTDEALRRDIELSQAAGFNGARLHEKVFEPRFLYWADRLGYLVWGEFPNWGLDHKHPGTLERVLTEWVDVMERDVNHPSIITWCPFNETPLDQNPELLRTVYRVTKAIDPTRPVVDTSGWVHVESDLYTCHNYLQDVVKFAELFESLSQGEAGWRGPNAAHAPGQPYLVDEYGGVWWDPAQSHTKGWGYGNRPQSKEEFIERVRGLTAVLLRNPHVCGFCYTQLTDVEQEVNGLYTFDRRPKADTEVWREIFGAPAAIEARLG